MRIKIKKKTIKNLLTFLLRGYSNSNNNSNSKQVNENLRGEGLSPLPLK